MPSETPRVAHRLDKDEVETEVDRYDVRSLILLPSFRCLRSYCLCTQPLVDTFLAKVTKRIITSLVGTEGRMNGIDRIVTVVDQGERALIRGRT